MIAGILDKRVVIQQRTDTQDTNGQLVPSWSTWNTVWSAWYPIKGTEQFEANRLTQKVDFRVRMRYISGIDHTMRISYNSNYYNIISINELGRKGGYELYVSLHRDIQ